MYKVLSLDGGGIKGVLQAAILARLEHARPGFVAQFDMLAGTSVGGLIALGLAAGLSAEDVCSMLVGYGKRIFRPKLSRRLLGLFGATGPLYDATALRRALYGSLPDRNVLLGDLETDVFVPAFQLDNRAESGRRWSPKFFHNVVGEDSDGAERLIDVAMRTSAAPIYFPSFGRYIDGGMAANNPAAAAIWQTQDRRNARQIALAEVMVLSIGSGVPHQWIEGSHLQWGALQYGTRLFDMMMDASSQTMSYGADKMLGDRYLRLQPQLERSVGLAEVDAIPFLIDTANAVLLDPILDMF